MKNTIVAITKEEFLNKTKKDIIEEFAIHKKDRGSTEVQVAVLTWEIILLTEHLKEHPKDLHSKRGLLKKVNQRRKLLKYLASKSKDKYSNLIGRLGLRR